MLFSYRLLFGAAALVCSCAARRASDASAGPSNPADTVPPARREAPEVKPPPRREAGFLQRFHVTAPGGRFRVQVRAAAPPSTSAQSDRVVVEIPVGGNEPIRCEVFDEALRP